MKYELIFKNMEHDDNIEKKANAVFEKLSRYVKDEYSCNIIVRQDNDKTKSYTVSANVEVKGKTYLSSDTNVNYMTAIENVFKNIKTNILNNKEKRITKKRNSSPRAYDDGGDYIED